MTLFISEHPWMFISIYGMTLIIILMGVEGYCQTLTVRSKVKADRDIQIKRIECEAFADLKRIEVGVEPKNER